jgi:hypothetical protein
MHVKIPGAGGGEPSIALIVDSVKFNIRKSKLTNQRLLLLQSDTCEVFLFNGVLGYSLFGHYTTQINYDDNRITLHADAILGSSSLRNFNLIFDYLHRRLYIKPIGNYRKRVASDGCPNVN